MRVPPRVVLMVASITTVVLMGSCSGDQAAYAGSLVTLTEIPTLAIPAGYEADTEQLGQQNQEKGLLDAWMTTYADSSAQLMSPADRPCYVIVSARMYETERQARARMRILHRIDRDYACNPMTSANGLVEATWPDDQSMCENVKYGGYAFAQWRYGRIVVRAGVHEATTDQASTPAEILASVAEHVERMLMSSGHRR